MDILVELPASLWFWLAGHTLCGLGLAELSSRAMQARGKPLGRAAYVITILFWEAILLGLIAKGVFVALLSTPVKQEK